MSEFDGFDGGRRVPPGLLCAGGRVLLERHRARADRKVAEAMPSADVVSFETPDFRMLQMARPMGSFFCGL